MRYADANSVYGINKARLIKRIAAACLDFVIFALVAVGVATLVSYATGYDSYREKLDAKYEEYGLYATIDPSLPEEEQTGSIFCQIKEEGDACSTAWKAFYDDDEATTLLHTCTNITLTTVAVGLLGGAFVAYFLIPFFLKNGQSFGKKFMRIAIVNNNGIRVRPINLFVRFLFGIYVVELMVPFYGIVYILSGSAGGIFATAIILAIAISNLFLVSMTRYGMAIHDLVGKTIVVELEGQAIFDTIEELNEHRRLEEEKNKESMKKRIY